ncbi:MAG: secretin N-terminal domain-containing protein, partial [Planctomycetota bacterium]|nr:secretin N-terminal domain-containing protein [Planctomycetota bacterium]
YETLGAADAEALRVIIEADERSNSLIVGGSAEGFKIVEGLARQLDGASPAISGQIQIFPLEHANAGNLSTSLSNLFDERYQAARTEDVRRQKPVILPDLRINALLVAANADDSKILKSLLEKLDVELKDPTVQLVVVPLRFNDAGIVGPTLESLFAARLLSMTPPGQQPMPQDRVDVAVDTLSNALIISASKENLGLISDLLKKVDVEPPDETGIVRMYALKTADAQRVGTMLENLVSQGFYKPGVLLAGDSALVQAREKVAIAVDIRTNALIVSASKENFAVIEEIIKQVDSTEDFSVLGDIRLFTLKNADATRLAPTLQQLFDAKRRAEVEAGSAGRMLPVSVIPDGRTNTLLVTGSREGLKAIEVMIKDLDAEQVLAANEFKVFYLENATATVLQPTLEQVFAQRVTRGDPPSPVTIVSEPRTNALLVSGSPDDLRLAESLIARLDAKPDRPGTAVSVFPLKKGDATQVAETLRALYAQPGAAAGATVGISVDERINAILVSAGPADLERMSQLVEQLDTDSVPRITEIRVFTLENADATELALILNDAINQKPDPLTQASPNRQALLQFISRTEDGAEQVASALQEGVLITPDARTNSLVISAPTENMRLLGNLVRAMDETQPRTAEIRVFTLVNSDARAMAQVLSELFRMGQAAADRQAVEYRLLAEQGADGEGKGEGAAARIGSAQDVALTVTVDIRTNSLLVGGTRHYVDLASEVIQELDQSTATERLTEVYRLRNAQATDIETAVTNFLNQERDVLEQALGGTTGGTLPFILEREVAIVAESTSNTLLLSASPRYYQVIADMIEELDQPPPQVLVQVLLADVTIDDTEEFGVEWNVRERYRSHDLLGGTAPAFSASAGLTLNQGFTVSVTGGDVNFLLRAIEAQGRVEILSRPQILATDNQEATINIGQRVPFITNSRITEDGTTINTIEYEDVGIILNVTPRITPDGFVRMEVNPEISSIDDSTVPISTGVNAIVVNSRSAETTVTVQDGHTIVVGGLIRTTDRDHVNKVPFLGDVPVLGNLFRSTRKVKERTELLIILTPTVLQNTEDVDAGTLREVRRLNLLRASHDGGIKEETLNEYGKEMFDEFRLQGADRDRPEPVGPEPVGPEAVGPDRPDGADARRQEPDPAKPNGATLAVPARREDRSP